MKNTLIIMIMIFSLKNHAQSPILPLYNTSRDTQAAYYKDLDNDLDRFAGTWKYTNGSTSLTITMQKKLMQEYTDTGYHFFEDIIIGEYKYVDNSVEKINTLPQISLDTNPYAHNIVGNILMRPTNRILRTDFGEPDRDIPGMEQAMFFERVDVNGVQKLKLTFRMTEGPIEIEGQPLAYTGYTLPFGEYILIKQ